MTKIRIKVPTYDKSGYFVFFSCLMYGFYILLLSYLMCITPPHSDSDSIWIPIKILSFSVFCVFTTICFGIWISPKYHVEEVDIKDIQPFKKEVVYYNGKLCFTLDEIDFAAIHDKAKN